jgi:hypothetical protein
MEDLQVLNITPSAYDGERKRNKSFRVCFAKYSLIWLSRDCASLAHCRSHPSANISHRTPAPPTPRWDRSSIALYHGCHRSLDSRSPLRSPCQDRDAEQKATRRGRLHLDLPVPQSGARQRGECPAQQSCCRLLPTYL